MKKIVLGILPFLFLLGLGCDDPPDDPGPRTYSVSGDLIRDDGTPAVGIKVKLMREDAEVDSVETDDDGGYSFSVAESSTTDSVLGTAIPFGVRASVPVGGQSAEVGLDFGLTSTKSLPTLRFLEAPLAHTVGADNVTVTVPNYADGNDQRPEGFELEVTTQSGWLVVTGEAGASSSVVRVPLLLLEDFATVLRLKAVLAGSGEVVGFAAGPSEQLPAQNPAPISRGATCTYSNLNDQTGTALSPCPVTDGNLETSVDPGATICTDPDPEDAIDECASTWERLVVDLGAVETISLFAVHAIGAGASLLLEISDDGSAFSNVTTIAQDNFMFTTPISARYLRLSYMGMSMESVLAGLNEIVVY